MLPPPLPLLALCLAAAVPVLAVKPGGFDDGGNTLVSAMMLFVGNDEKVYVLDKAEGNAAQVAGHPAWGAVWDMASRQAQVMDVPSNVFCSSGYHLPNGSYTAFGGNGAVGRGGAMGSSPNPGNFTGAWDSEYQDFDGSKAIRILNPCKNTDNFNSPACQWFDDSTKLAMKAGRWYSTAEALADGTIALIGGFSTGGYVNRNYPNTDPNGGGSQNTYEFYPSRPGDPAVPPNLPFLTRTSGLNAYVHAFMMPSGKMFLQANISAILWDYNANTETDLPDMPGQVVRVYPASGAVAMLPLTPQNNYTPTIIFCGGSDMPDEAWGNFSWPFTNTWDYPASNDCHRITPEPTDGSAPVYVQDDNMFEGRTMGQFIILPDGTLLVVNGGLNGTAGYSQGNLFISDPGLMPFGESLASGPVGTPAIYNPNAASGKRWSRDGFATSSIARLYHSSAMLLPDGSVMIAGSNPNIDVNTTTIFPTQYKAEIFYPPYFAATTRPAPLGIPTTLTYGGQPFDITIPASSYSGPANDAADNTIVSVVRGGFTTHAMNMGQRFLQLNNTYTIQSNGSIVLHVSQMPPIPEIFQPGPAFIYVVIKGIPSNGSYAIVGSGAVGTQNKLPVGALPGSVRLDSAQGSASTQSTQAGNNGSNGSATSSSGVSTGTIIGAAVGGVVLVGILGAIIGVCLARRRRAAAREAGATGYPMSSASAAGGAGLGALGVAGTFSARGPRESDSSAFVPLQQGNQSHAWNASSSSLVAPYKDDGNHQAHHQFGDRESSRGSFDTYGAPPPRGY